MKNRSIAVALLLLGITACTGFNSGSVSPRNAPTTLQVDNQGFLDMTVYAIRNSQRALSDRPWYLPSDRRQPCIGESGNNGRPG